MEEKCVNCGKTKDEHIIDKGVEKNVWCFASVRSFSEWTPPEPQAALFEADPVKTGYEI